MLALVAAGRSNRRIAQALFISPKTVGVHVSSLLAKLGWRAGWRPPRSATAAVRPPRTRREAPGALDPFRPEPC
jgi:DNA-binding NarL/FixJ family response regulator